MNLFGYFCCCCCCCWCGYQVIFFSSFSSVVWLGSLTGGDADIVHIFKVTVIPLELRCHLCCWRCLSDSNSNLHRFKFTKPSHSPSYKFTKSISSHLSFLNSSISFHQSLLNSSTYFHLTLSNPSISIHIH